MLTVDVWCTDCGAFEQIAINPADFFVDDWLVISRKDERGHHVPFVNTELWFEWDYNKLKESEPRVLAAARKNASEIAWYMFCMD